MVSRENAVILLFAVGALALAFGAGTLTDLSDGALVAVVIGLGVVAPQLVIGYLDRTDPT
mgnify:CR=1 FL=1